MPSHRTGVLIIRAWVEEGSAEPLRAHIRMTGDIANGMDEALTLVHRDRVAALVDSWLQGVLGPNVP